ncbi:MFS transporter [Pseudoflavonifractor sp.]|jgi:MFS family permease|uniref:MFS transporter n=1 Tax=Pseudoflavonifractor sp. TaxID=1980281 RepID=UPI003D935D71
MKKAKKGFLGWYMVILASLITTFSGNFGSNAQGVANTLMMTSPENTVTQVAYGLSWTITQIVAALGGLLMGSFVDRFGAKKMFIVGSLLSILSGFVLVQFQAGSSLMFLFNYGFVVALSYQCVSFVTTQSVVSNWLQKRRGTGGAIVNTGTVIAGIITAPIVTWLINSVGNGNWKYGYYYFGAASIIGLILSFFIINKPSDVGQYPDGVEPGRDAGDTPKKGQAAAAVSRVFKNVLPENHYTFKQALRSPLLWALIVLHACSLCLSNYIMNPGSLLFVQAGFAMETVSTVLSIRQVIRLLFLAFLMRYLDKIEPVKLLTFTCALAGVCYLVSANPTSYWQILVFYAGGSIVMSAQMAIPGVMLANIFGTTNFGKIYGAYLMVATLISSVSPTISGTIAQNTGSYVMANYLWASIAVVALVAGLVSIRLFKKETGKILAVTGK